MKAYFFLISFFIATFSYAQSLSITPIKSVIVKGGKVVFEKELDLDINNNSSYEILRMWARDSYGKDPFISSLRYDSENKSITAKSRIELLLPPDSKNVREKIVMRYRIDVSIMNRKCYIVFRDISYLYDNPLKPDLLPKVSKAEELITDQALYIRDARSELRSNIRKSTLYFINQTCSDLNNKMHGK